MKTPPTKRSWGAVGPGRRCLNDSIAVCSKRCVDASVNPECAFHSTDRTGATSSHRSPLVAASHRQADHEAGHQHDAQHRQQRAQEPHRPGQQDGRHQECDRDAEQAVGPGLRLVHQAVSLPCGCSLSFSMVESMTKVIDCALNPGRGLWQRTCARLPPA